MDSSVNTADDKTVSSAALLILTAAPEKERRAKD